MRIMRLVLIVLAGAWLPTMVTAQVRSQATEQVKTAQKAYVATYADGSKEQVVVAYEGEVYHKIWQTGDASHFPEHLVDDRKCHIQTKASVARRAYLISRSGVRAPLENYEDIYRATSYTDRGADNLLEGLTRHVTCGPVMDQFKQRVASVETALIKDFEGLLKKDDDVSRARLKAMLDAKELVESATKPAEPTPKAAGSTPKPAESKSKP